MKLAWSGGTVTAALHRGGDKGLLLTHGAGGDLDSAGLVALAEGLCDEGFTVLRFNLPFREAGRGPPRAELSVKPFAELCADAARKVKGVSWAVGGRSYGGRVASLAVADGLVKANALVFWSYPLHPPGKPNERRVVHWPRVKTKCLFLIGTADPFGTPDELLHELPALKRAKVHVVEGGDHALAVAKKRAPDGVRRTEAQSGAALAPVVAKFLR